MAIVIGVKHKSSGQGANVKAGQEPLAQVYHTDLWGNRKGKYEALWESNIASLTWQLLDLHPRYLMFYPINGAMLDRYDAGFAINEFMPGNQIGITTSRDDLVVSFNQDEAQTTLKHLYDDSITDDVIRARYFRDVKGKKGRLPGDTASWQLNVARRLLKSEVTSNVIKPIAYRPFDHRLLLYSEFLLERPRIELIPSVIDPPMSLSFNRKIDEDRPFTDVFVFDQAVQLHSLSIKESNYVAPLYLTPKDGELDQTRRVNFDPKLYAKLRKLTKNTQRGEPDEVAVFDYIYGVLHCPAYRETYAEFLKIDFPRIPWPASADVFWDVSDKGGQLRRLHLMEPVAIGETPFPFTGAGDGSVEKPEYREGAVWINTTQRFENAPEISWDFWIGGYQPAQKWLKDRRGRTLDYEDVEHYQRILKILSETDRIMKTIVMPLDAAEAAD